MAYIKPDEVVDLSKSDKPISYKEEIKKSLRKSYVDVSEVISTLTPPPSHTPLMTHKDILDNLSEILPSVVESMLRDNMGVLKMSRIIETEYYEDLVDISLITYGLIFAASDFILGNLLFYIEKTYMYEYIKNKVVRPRVREIVEDFKKINDYKTYRVEETEAKEKLFDEIESLVEAFMITKNISILDSALKKIAAIELDNKKEQIDVIFDSIKYAYPDLLKELVSLIDSDENMSSAGVRPRVQNIMKDLQEFYHKYYQTHTVVGYTNLMNSYIKNHSVDTTKSKIDSTQKLRDSYHVASELPKIDGMTYTELQVAKRILDKNFQESDKEIINSSIPLRNLKVIIDRYKMYNDIASISEDKVVIYNTDSKTSKSYDFLSKEVSEELDDEFSLFGQSRKVVRQKFKNKSSCLHQTGVLDSDKVFLNTNNKHNVYSLNPEQAIEHRKRQIYKLLTQFNKNETIMNTYRSITETTIQKPRFINISQDCPYVEKSPVDLFYKLVETQTLYDQIMRAKEEREERVLQATKNGGDIKTAINPTMGGIR